MPAKQVLSVGQCGADHAAISLTIERHFQAKVVPADTVDEAVIQLQNERFALILVNRVFDADGTSGVQFVKHLKEQAAFAVVPVMLVSNYEDSQREAVDAGAVPGFGKAGLGQPRMLDRMRRYLGE